MLANSIGIVGCGFTGTSALHQLLDTGRVMSITVFDRSGTFGPGFAYQADETPAYLMNNTNDTLCLRHTDRTAFLEWLRATRKTSPDPLSSEPRRAFGEFLAAAVEEAKHRAERLGVKLEFVAENVTSIQDEAGGVIVETENDRYRFDKIIISTGRGPSVSPDKSFRSAETALYFPTHVRTVAVDAIPLDASVHVLGASLSAYDIVNRLFPDTEGAYIARDDGTLDFQSVTNRRVLTLCSRSGRLKKVQSQTREAPARTRFTLEALSERAGDGHIDLKAISEAIKADLVSCRDDYDETEIFAPYRDCGSIDDVSQRAADILARDILRATDSELSNGLVDILDDAQDDLWEGFASGLLKRSDEVIYRREIETALLCYTAPCPLVTANRLLALLRAGRVRLLVETGTPALSADETHFLIPHRFGVERASILIDATGRTHRNVSDSFQDAWVKSLVARGRLRPYTLDDGTVLGAEVDPETLSLPDMPNAYLANAMLWGPGFFTSSAYTMARLVSKIVSDIYPEESL